MQLIIPALVILIFFYIKKPKITTSEVFEKVKLNGNKAKFQFMKQHFTQC